MGEAKDSVYVAMYIIGIPDDVCLDSPGKVLRGKAVVIDAKLCFIGSTNWTRASIEDNHEFTLARGKSIQNTQRIW